MAQIQSKPVPESAYKLLLELINETYLDGMDSIQEATSDSDGSLRGIAIDEGKTFVFEYIDDHLELRLAHENETKTAKFAAGKPRNCKVGVSCGGSCISKTKTCRKKASASQQEKAKEITALVHVPGKGSLKDVKESLKDVKEKTEYQIPDDAGEWLKNVKFDRSKYSDFGVTDLTSTAKVNEIYKTLSRKFHPDRGGTSEQMANLNKLREQMLAMAEMNEEAKAHTAMLKVKREAAKARKAAKGLKK